MRRINPTSSMELLTNRRGGNTVEYVIILTAALLLATGLYYYMSGDGKQTLQATIKRILSLENVSISPPSSEGSDELPAVPNTSNTPDILDTPTTSDPPPMDLPPTSTIEDQPQPNAEPPQNPDSDDTDQNKPNITQTSSELSSWEVREEKRIEREKGEGAGEEPELTEEEERELREAAMRYCGQRGRVIPGKNTVSDCIDDYIEENKDDFKAQEPLPPEAQFVADLIIDNIPGLGNVTALLEALTGYDKWGDDLSSGERILSGAGVVLPWFKNLKYLKLLKHVSPDEISNIRKKLARSEHSDDLKNEVDNAKKAIKKEKERGDLSKKEKEEIKELEKELNELTKELEEWKPSIKDKKIRTYTKKTQSGNTRRYMRATDGREVKLKMGHMAGKKHPVTGVPYDSNGFPDFKNYKVGPDLNIDESIFLKNDFTQFKGATKQLKTAINKDPKLKKKFNKEQLEAIDNEEDRIPGFTWHHHQEPGKMQLVPTEIHSKTGHTGGRDIWGGGKEKR